MIVTASPATERETGIAPPDALVAVQREWNGWRSAMVRLVDLENIRWFQPPGAPRPLLHADVACTAFVDGDLPHGCERSAPPHRVRVCVIKSHLPAVVFAELAGRADRRGT